jgi:putative membrane protein
MYAPKQLKRRAPGIFSYIEIFSSKLLAYCMFFGTPVIISAFSLIIYLIFQQEWTFIYIFTLTFIYLIVSSSGVIISLIFYSKKAPILKLPPKGWTIQFNFFFTSIIGGSFVFGKIMVFFFENNAFQEVFFMLGALLAYILAFVIYFSFTTLGYRGSLILSLIQPVIAIISYSVFTVQFSVTFFFRAIVFFCSCAFLFAIPYGRGMSHVSKIYREATGLGGYRFIRAFVLSMITDGNDDQIEELFDNVGIMSKVKIQYLLIRTERNNDLKGIFVVPNVHFGPFKTCGSSDLPEHIYKALKDVLGATVYHTTNDHTQNLTTQGEVDKIIKKIKIDIHDMQNDSTIKWIKNVKDFSRHISNSAKLIGFKIGDVPIVFLTRHPLPSDDIQVQVGEEIRDIAESNGFRDIMTIDAHNSIIGDEILIIKDSIEANDLINVSRNYLSSKNIIENNEIPLLYGVAKDKCSEFTEKDGIGIGGIVVHLFKNSKTEQKTALIHFDANNAYIEIRSYVLNMLQNRGIERGEITTSDSHTVARQLTRRGYSPIGDRIKIDIILEKLKILIKEAEKDLEPVEFYYRDSIVENIKIWGNPSYFNVIMATIQECLRVSQRLLSLSLIIPTFFSLILLLFYYNLPIL